MPRVKRTNIMSLPDGQKFAIYDEVDKLFHSGSRVSASADESGFPAVRLDALGRHYLTDCLSMDEWCREHYKDEVHHRLHIEMMEAIQVADTIAGAKP